MSFFDEEYTKPATTASAAELQSVIFHRDEHAPTQPIGAGYGVPAWPEESDDALYPSAAAVAHKRRAFAFCEMSRSLCPVHAQTGVHNSHHLYWSSVLTNKALEGQKCSRCGGGCHCCEACPCHQPRSRATEKSYTRFWRKVLADPHFGEKTTEETLTAEQQEERRQRARTLNEFRLLQGLRDRERRHRNREQKQHRTHSELQQLLADDRLLMSSLLPEAWSSAPPALPSPKAAFSQSAAFSDYDRPSSPLRASRPGSPAFSPVRPRSPLRPHSPPTKQRRPRSAPTHGRSRPPNLLSRPVSSATRLQSHSSLLRKELEERTGMELGSERKSRERKHRVSEAPGVHAQPKPAFFAYGVGNTKPVKDGLDGNYLKTWNRNPERPPNMPARPQVLGTELEDLRRMQAEFRATTSLA